MILSNIYFAIIIPQEAQPTRAARKLSETIALQKEHVSYSNAESIRRLPKMAKNIRRKLEKTNITVGLPEVGEMCRNIYGYLSKKSQPQKTKLISRLNVFNLVASFFVFNSLREAAPKFCTKFVETFRAFVKFLQKHFRRIYSKGGYRYWIRCFGEELLSLLFLILSLNDFKATL